MKPASFEYVTARTVEEAVRALADSEGEGKCLAGGQSLVPLMNFRLARPPLLVDLGQVDELRQLRHDDDGSLVVGALVTHREVAGSPLIAERVPLLAEAAREVGHAAIRNRGTIGGSFAHADPVAELPCVGLTLDAEIVAAGPHRRRTIAAADFFQGPFTTALAADEVLVEIRFPASGAERSGWAFCELARRRGDLAVVGVAAQLERRGQRLSARIGLAGVAGRPVRAVAAEAGLSGATPDAASFRAAGEAVAASLAPPSDIHGSAALRRRVASVLTERALERAARRLEAA